MNQQKKDKSKIYNQQATTYESIPRIIELLVSPDFNTRAYAKQNLQAFRNNVEEMTGREMQLMSYIKDAEAILELEKIK